MSWAGPRWTNTGTTICDIMEKSNTGMIFEDPSGELKVEKIADLFVDDTATGIANLPSQYSHLFRSTLDRLLSYDLATKQKWLASIWSARENHSGLQLHRDPGNQHNYFFLRWRLQADPTRAIAERRALQRQLRCSRRSQAALIDRPNQRSRVEIHQPSSSESDSE